MPKYIRMTIDLDDDVNLEVREIVRKEGRTLKSVLNELIYLGLSGESEYPNKMESSAHQAKEGKTYTLGQVKQMHRKLVKKGR